MKENEKFAFTIARKVITWEREKYYFPSQNQETANARMLEIINKQGADPHETQECYEVGFDVECEYLTPAQNEGRATAIITNDDTEAELFSNVNEERAKFYLIKLNERNGEQEYTQTYLIELPAGEDARKYAETELIPQWYGDDSDAEGNDGGYYFFGGCIFVELYDVIELSEQEFLTLKKYI